MSENDSFVFEEVTSRNTRNDTFPVPVVPWDSDHGIYDIDPGMHSMQQNDNRFLQVRMDEYKRVSGVLHVECMKQNKLIIKLHTLLKNEVKKRKHLELTLRKAEERRSDELVEMGRVLHIRDCEFRRRYDHGGSEQLYAHDHDDRRVSKGYAKELHRDHTLGRERDTVNDRGRPRHKT
jgi:hypothetical protein